MSKIGAVVGLQCSDMRISLLHAESDSTSYICSGCTCPRSARK